MNTYHDLIIQQIQPFFLKNQIPFKTALCALVKKQATGNLLANLTKNNLTLNNLHLNNNDLSPSFTADYQKPSNTNKTNEKLYDCSFLKRVKPFNKDENLIIISFLDHLNFLALTKEKISTTFGVPENKLVEQQIPSVQPITQKQYLSCKEKWPLVNMISDKEKYIYDHDEKEKEKILKVFQELKNDKDYSSYLYDPNNQKIISKGKKGKFCIEHSIMNMLSSYSSLLVQNSQLGRKSKSPPKEGSELLFSDQYFGEGMYVFTKEEPCLMCSMALVHNRVSRIYFSEINEVEGALCSKIELNNYNLNHHYLVFRIKDNLEKNE